MEQPDLEIVRIKGNKVQLGLYVKCLMDGDNYLMYSPTLEISGYGDTEKEAEESFKHICKETFREILELPKKDIDSYLSSFGFKKQKFKNKNFSKAFVDDDGVLRDLNIDLNTVKTSKVEIVA